MNNWYLSKNRSHDKNDMILDPKKQNTRYILPDLIIKIM